MLAQSQPEQKCLCPLTTARVRAGCGLRVTYCWQSPSISCIIDEAVERPCVLRKTTELTHLHATRWVQDFNNPRLNQALATWYEPCGIMRCRFVTQSYGIQAEQWWYFLNDLVAVADNNLAERSLR
jgi:hypothetical protein